MFKLDILMLILIGMLLSVTVQANQANHDIQGKQINLFGWIEKITLEPWGVEVKAKLDSGALTSSLDGRDIERFKKGGESWVRFRLEIKNEATGEIFTQDVEREVQRKLILRGAGGDSRRPSVLMKLCIGNRLYEEEFSIRDRSDMIYPVLLGRRTIAHLGALDVGRTFLTSPECKEDTPIVSPQTQ